MQSHKCKITDFYSRKTYEIRCFHSVPSPGATVLYSSSGLSRVPVNRLDYTCNGS
jgi:hypothetical protein